jgi:hypothetical protein
MWGLTTVSMLYTMANTRIVKRGVQGKKLPFTEDFYSESTLNLTILAMKFCIHIRG